MQRKTWISGVDRSSCCLILSFYVGYYPMDSLKVCKPDKVLLHKTRFGYFDFRLNFLNLSRNGAILPKILCRIQIWVSKIEIQTGQNFKHQKKTKNLKKYCIQNSFSLFSTHTVQSYCIYTLNIQFLHCYCK